MGTTKNAVYKVDNGSDFDEIHFKTNADMVLCDIVPTDVILKNPNNQSYSLKDFLNAVINSGINSNGISIKKTNGDGASLFHLDNRIYFFIAQDNAIAANSITGICLRRTSHFSQHAINVLHSNGLSIGVKNSMGTQVINGAAASNITCIAIGFPFYQ